MAKPTLNIQTTITGLGALLTSTVARQADGAINIDLDVPMGYAGTLTTRTDDNTGTITLGAGHGITTGMAVDIYWGTGSFQYGVTVGTVSVNSVPFDAGANGGGGNLPSQSTAVIVSPRVKFEENIDPATLAALAYQMKFETAEGAASSLLLVFSEEDDVETVVKTSMMEADVVRSFTIVDGDDPFDDSAINGGYVSNRSTTSDATFKMVGVDDVTP